MMSYSHLCPLLDRFLHSLLRHVGPLQGQLAELPEQSLRIADVKPCDVLRGAAISSTTSDA